AEAGPIAVAGAIAVASALARERRGRGWHRALHRLPGGGDTVREDRDAPVRFLALTFGADARLLFERDVHDASLVGLHRIHHHPLACAPHALRQPERHLLDGFLAPVAVVLDVDDEAATVDASLIEDQIDDGLKGPDRLSPPADQQAQVIAGDIDHHRVVGLLDKDLRRDPHLVEKLGPPLGAFTGTL